MSNFAERLYRITKRHPTLKNKGKLSDYLGCSRSMIYNYENGNPPPPRDLLDKVSALEISLGIEGSTIGQSQEVMPSVDGGRRIPVVGWAHAGDAVNYDELPHDWRDWIPTDCRDPKAFGVFLEGDSMEPRFQEGDLLVLMPGEEAHSGCLAVCKFLNDGVVFRRIERLGEEIRLVPLNSRYEPSNHARSEFAWIYPVWGRWSQLWKR